MRLSVVSVCLNDAKVLPLFLDNMETWETRDLHYVVADNGSSDGSPEMILERFPAVDIVRMDLNRGTTGGYNRALERVREKGSEYVLFLALDVLLAPDCLRVLTSLLEERPEIGAAGPVLFKSNDRSLVECMGFRIAYDWSYVPYLGGRRESMDMPETVDVDYIDGGTALFRMSALDRAGSLDESLFMYGEDVDICLRLRKQGYRIAAASRARAWHRHTEILLASGRVQPYQVYYLHRNRGYIVAKHASGAGKLAYYLGVLARLPRHLAFYLARQRNARLARIHLEALWHGLTKRMGKTNYVQ